MQAPAALIVAHGQPSAPQAAEADMRALAAEVGAHLPGWRIAGATLAASGGLEAALAGLGAPVIFPFFMADGWFTESALPRRLGAAGLSAPRILPPFGLLAAATDLATTVVAEALATRGWNGRDTTVLLAAHGSGRSARPAAAARALTAQIAAALALDDCRLGFIEEPPGIAEVARGTRPRALCLPLFVARWGHVEHDIPAALAAANFPGPLLPPLGADPRVPALIASSIAAA